MNVWERRIVVSGLLIQLALSVGIARTVVDIRANQERCVSDIVRIQGLAGQEQEMIIRLNENDRVLAESILALQEEIQAIRNILNLPEEASCRSEAKHRCG